MGSLIYLIVCPYHSDNKPSCAVYERDNGTYSYYCFGCKQRGQLSPYLKEQLDNGRMVVKKKNLIVKKSVDMDRFTILDKVGVDFISSRQIHPLIAEEYGIRQSSTKLWIPSYTFAGLENGGQLRNLVDDGAKYLHMPNSGGKYAKYSIVPRDSSFKDGSCIFVVESVLDGLCLYTQLNKPSIAMLGTKVAEDVITYLTNTNRKIIILTDPDAHIFGSMLRHRLDSIGLDVVAMFPDRKPYELDYEEFEVLIREALNG